MLFFWHGSYKERVEVGGGDVAPSKALIGFVKRLESPPKPCKRNTYWLVWKDGKEVLMWTNFKVQTLLPLVTEDSPRWELDEYFNVAKKRVRLERRRFRVLTWQFATYKFTSRPQTVATLDPNGRTVS